MIIWSANSPYPWVSKDKQKHLFAGALAGGAAVLYLFTVPTPNGWWLPIAVASAAGVIKEVVDLIAGKTAEVADFVNTAAGGAIAAAIYAGLVYG